MPTPSARERPTAILLSLLAFMAYGIIVGDSVRCKQTGLKGPNLWFSSGDFYGKMGTCEGPSCYAVVSKEKAGQQQLSLGCGDCAAVKEQNGEDPWLECSDCSKNLCNDRSALVKSILRSTKCALSLENATIMAFCGIDAGRDPDTLGQCAVEVLRVNKTSTEVTFTCKADCDAKKRIGGKAAAGISCNPCEASTGQKVCLEVAKSFTNDSLPIKIVGASNTDVTGGTRVVSVNASKSDTRRTRANSSTNGAAVVSVSIEGVAATAGVTVLTALTRSLCIYNYQVHTIFIVMVAYFVVGLSFVNS